MNLSYTTNREMPNAVKYRNAFRGNSAYGVWAGSDYQIYSYSTLIYSSKENYFNINDFSVTTAKIQGIIAREIYGISLKSLRRLKAKGEKIIKETIDYSLLYYDKEVKVQKDSVAPYPITLDIKLRDFKGVPDCQIGHFGYNFFYRTSKGLKKQKHATRSSMEKAIENLLRKRGFEVLGWIDSK
jgi:hypothetical protein